MFNINNIESQESEAKDFVEELRETLETVHNSIETLEGMLSDAEMHSNLELDWTYGNPPSITGMLQSISLDSAKFTYEKEL